jgi:hypothetical protein
MNCESDHGFQTQSLVPSPEPLARLIFVRAIPLDQQKTPVQKAF